MNLSVKLLIGGCVGACLFTSAPAETLDKLYPPDFSLKGYDDACANMAGAADANLKDPIVARWIEQCSHHPNKIRCEQTLKYVIQAENVPPGFKCYGQ